MKFRDAISKLTFIQPYVLTDKFNLLTLLKYQSKNEDVHEFTIIYTFSNILQV